MLGSLLVSIVIVAIAISVRLYTQLGNSVSLERSLIVSQRDLDEIVQTQVDLQSALRGFVVTGDSSFLEPFGADERRFAAAVDEFDRTTKSLQVERMSSTVAEIRGIHASWTADVANPLISDPHTKGFRTRVELGTIYIGQLRGDTARVHDLLGQRLEATEGELKHRIDEALLGGIASIVVFGFVSIVFVTSRVQMQDAIDRERSIVDTLQRAFREDPGNLAGVRIGTAYLSAERAGAVGGDLYDVRRLDDGRGLILIADVSGKGIPAAVNTAFVRYSIAALVRGSSDPANVVAEFNRMFLGAVGDPSLFVVLFVGLLAPDGRTLAYASAGHSGAYLRHGGDVMQLDVTGPIVGVDASFAYESRTLALAPGDMLVLATDGLSEARDGDGLFLGDEGAMQILASSTETDPQRFADRTVTDLRTRGNGKLADDLALLVVAIDGAAAC